MTCHLPMVIFVSLPPNLEYFIPIGNHQNNAPNTFIELVFREIHQNPVSYPYHFDVDYSRLPLSS